MLNSILRTTLATQFGLYGAAQTQQSLSVKYCNAATGCAIIRSARELLPMVWASVTLMNAPEGQWIWRVVHVAGTIRSVQRAAMKHIVRKLEVMTEKVSAEEQTKFIELVSKCKAAIRSIEA
jgi:RNase P/RNase MRP subunit POP5